MYLFCSISDNSRKSAFAPCFCNVKENVTLPKVTNHALSFSVLEFLADDFF